MFSSYFEGLRIVWVEHAKTGDLVPVVLHGGVVVEDVDDNVYKKKNDDEDENLIEVDNPLLSYPPPLGGNENHIDAQFVNQQESTYSHTDTVVLIRSIYLFAQGLLAGFCFTSIANQTSITSGGDTEFLVSHFIPKTYSFFR